ncbi:MAG: hypothetical protein GTN93_30590 [Anaerolineae bacterium]|nr:hypothetical protein [Anaerolineae bacterium]
MNSASSSDVGPAQSAQPRPDGQNAFEKFLLSEYEHIAQAHFTTVGSISHFFQYYVLLASLPVSVAVAFGKLEVLRDVVRAYPASVAIGLSAIALVGLVVMGYVVNLRHDAVLYARTINGLRKYFMERSGLDLRDELRIRVLPRSVHFPRYLEASYFGFVVSAFAIIDALYASGGWWVFFRLRQVPHSWMWLAAIAAATIVLHVSIYWGIARHREFGYLRGHIIGVDIDGVLSKHRERFCVVLQEVRDKTIRPEQITRIPVHECEGLGVTEDDEVAVFHEPRYWSDMEVYERCGDVLKRLRNQLHYQVCLFSWRGWPDAGRVPPGERRDLKRRWHDSARGSSWGNEAGLSLRLKARRVRERLRFWAWRLPIRRITRDWLWRNGIDYDRLIVERGNVDSPDRVGRVRNRFIISQDRKIRLFVEDDLDKARRLADICEVVFLIKHPYNQNRPPGDSIPNNIVEVDGWRDIYDYVRRKL